MATTIVKQKPELLLFGANSVSATTTQRWLFPGFGNSTANPTQVHIPAHRSGILVGMRVIHISPAGNGGDIVYTAEIELAPVGLSVTLPSTSSAGNSPVVSIPVAKDQRIGLTVTKPLSIGSSPSDILVSLQFE